MKFIKTNFVVILMIIIGLGLLALQTPVTKALTKNIQKAHELPSHYTIRKAWNLPRELDEVSGISWINKNTFACVQDEKGIIYLYDIEKSKVTNTFKFAELGDYEGISIVKDDAYVMRSDGLIFEIKNYKSNTRTVSEFKTLFSEKNNIESFTYDTDQNRFLTVPKDEDLKNNNFKNIYQISLESKTMDKSPIVKINMTDLKLKEFEHKEIQKTFNPSDIAIHPVSKEIYVLEGKKPKLMILNANGLIKEVFKLDKHLFEQPEGITFSEDGTLYISNEAGDMSATIVEIHLK